MTGAFDVWEEIGRRGAESVEVDGVELRSGSRVRLRPRPGRDAWDPALAGRTAVVESVEEDLEGGVHVAVEIEDDPGRDLGTARPGARFFFAPDELEPLPRRRILVAGVGNLFLGDDGFGCEVAALLAREGGLPAEATVVDFGIRGLDLAYALAGYDAAILVDAMPSGDPPGTLTVLEPLPGNEEAGVETHGVDPELVLRLARSLGSVPGRLLVVGCRPERVVDPERGDEMLAELSEPARAAVPEAARLVRELVAELLEPDAKGGELG